MVLQMSLKNIKASTLIEFLVNVFSFFFFLVLVFTYEMEVTSGYTIIGYTLRLGFVKIYVITILERNLTDRYSNVVSM